MEKIKDILPALIASVLASFVVGAFSAYMTGNVILARLETRMERAEQDVMMLSKKLETQADSASAANERLIRLETKIDILLKQGMQ